MIYTQFCRFLFTSTFDKSYYVSISFNYIVIVMIIVFVTISYYVYIFHRSEYKHKKFYFVNNTAKLYLKSQVQNYIYRYKVQIF